MTQAVELGMTEYFCLECATDQFGPEAMRRMQREVDEAPPFSPEQREQLRAIFQGPLVQRRWLREKPKKECGH